MLYKNMEDFENTENFQNTEDFNIFVNSDEDDNSDNVYINDYKRKHDNVEDKDSDIKAKKSPNQTRSYEFIEESSENISTSFFWLIEDTFFLPLGMLSHCMEGVKSAVIVWSDYSIINFIIKKNLKTKQTHTTEIRFDLFGNSEKVKDIIILELNTLILFENGTVKFFSSAKTMRTIFWLQNVRVISQAPPHGFSIIRVTDDRRLILEVYEDVTNMGKQPKGPLMHQYDITFDEQNLFDCTWEDEHFVLISISFEKENVGFLEHLIRHSCNLKNKTELHFFSVSGNVFVLIPDSANNDFQIEMIFSYASNIELLIVDCTRHCCLVFLESGTIDIWYMSRETRMLSHQLHYTGCKYTCFAYSSIHANFYFSDGSQVVRLNFNYDNVVNKIAITKSYKTIPGILACTWVESIQQLVCINSNNVFCQLYFEEITPSNDKVIQIATEPSTTVSDYEKFNILYEMKISSLLKKAHIVQQLTEMPQKYYDLIEKEYIKQQLLAMSDKLCFYQTLLTSYLEYSKGQFSIPPNTVLLYTENQITFDNHTTFALIHINIERNEAFEFSFWTLNFHFHNKAYTFLLPKCTTFSKICLVMPLQKCTWKLLPHFDLSLYTFVKHSTNFVAISLKFPLNEDVSSYAKLFSINNNEQKNISCRLHMKDLFKNYNNNNHSISDSYKLQYVLKIPKGINIWNAFTNLLHAKMTEVEFNKLLENENGLVLYFFNFELIITKQKDSLHLESKDAVTLYYLKLYFHQFFKSNFDASTLQINKSNLKIRLRYQTIIDNLCTQSMEESLCNIFSKLAKLKSCYQKMRREIAEEII